MEEERVRHVSLAEGERESLRGDPDRPDMKVDPGGQILNDGTEVGDVAGSAMGIGGVGPTTAGGGTGPDLASGTDPGPIAEGAGPVGIEEYQAPHPKRRD